MNGILIKYRLFIVYFIVFIVLVIIGMFIYDKSVNQVPLRGVFV